MVERIRCPLCARPQPLPKTEGYRCLSCGVTGEAQVTPDGEPRIMLDDLRAREDCPAGCGGKVTFQDAFCQSCGKPVPEELLATLKTAELQAQERLSRSRAMQRRGVADRKRKVARAGVWILVMAAAFLVLGTVSGLMTGSSIEQSIIGMGDMPDDAILPLPDGEEMTFAECKAQLRSVPTIIFITHYVLAAIMLALFFWAKRSPLPAIITAICVYAVVVVLSAIDDPTTLVRGWLFKFLFVVLMFGGLRAALAQRALEMQAQAREAMKG